MRNTWQFITESCSASFSIKERLVFETQPLQIRLWVDGHITTVVSHWQIWVPRDLKCVWKTQSGVLCYHRLEHVEKQHALPHCWTTRTVMQQLLLSPTEPCKTRGRFSSHTHQIHAPYRLKGEHFIFPRTKTDTWCRYRVLIDLWTRNLISKHWMSSQTPYKLFKQPWR